MGLLKLVVGSETRARVVPFLLFAGLTLLQGSLGPGSSYWFYLTKSILGLGLIALMWPVVREMRWVWSWQALAVGVLVFVLWVGIDPLYPQLQERAGWNPARVFGEGTPAAWGFLIVRFLGSTFVVPPLEEVFYRSFLYRYLANPRFLSVPLRGIRWTPFLATSVIFGLAHHEWLAGILCGLAYQWLTCRKGRPGEAITAHSVTNGLLGLWVVSRGQWHFW